MAHGIDSQNSSCIESFLNVSMMNVTISDRQSSLWWKGDPDMTCSKCLCLYPLNLAASLIGIAIAPIVFLVDLIAALIFKIAAWCSCSEENSRINHEKAFLCFAVGIGQITDIPFTLFVRIFSPSYSVTPCVIESMISHHRENRLILWEN